MASKLAKKLKKDIKKSPGKAIALAGALLVAGWFWAPLVKNMISGNSGKSATSSKKKTTEATAEVAAVAAVATALPSDQWKQLAAAIDTDPNMLPAEAIELEHDPFRPVAVEQKPKIVEVDANATAPVAMDVPPAAAGLTLTSTIVGPKLRVARIAGKTYRIGEIIEVAGGVMPLDYTLMEVHGRSVLLGRAGKTYELSMAQPGEEPTPQNNAASAPPANNQSETIPFDPSMFPVEQ